MRDRDRGPPHARCLTRSPLRLPDGDSVQAYTGYIPPAEAARLRAELPALIGGLIDARRWMEESYYYREDKWARTGAAVPPCVDGAFRHFDGELARLLPLAKRLLIAVPLPCHTCERYTCTSVCRGTRVVCAAGGGQ